MAARKPIVLFLQGPPTPLWTELADALAAEGARVLRVNLNFADRVFWGLRPSLSYRGRFRGWGRWLRALLDREGVTDILYYADRLPYHRVALKAARERNIAAHAVEFGYLRPDWVTLEREGGGAFSHFPEDPAFLDVEAPPVEPGTRHPLRFAAEAFWDVSYNLLDALGRPAFPFYFSDRYYAAIPDYLLWLVKLARSGRIARESAATQADLLGGGPFWLMAMQLQSDYQLRASAPWPHQRDVIRAVIRSFAAHAPAAHRLAFKLHPLENGREGFPRVIREIAAEHGVAGRVVSLAAGELGPLVAGAEGVVTINSTVGLHALRAGKPVKTLGAAVYAIEGLVDVGPLDGFWRAPRPPDRRRVRALVRTLARETQIRGSFHAPAGRAAAIAAISRRIMEGSVGPATWRPRAAPPRLAALAAARRAVREGRDPLGGGPADALSAGCVGGTARACGLAGETER